MLQSVEKQQESDLTPKQKSSIREIFSVQDIYPFLQDEDCALVWDIDNTILETNQLLGSDQWFAHFISEKLKNMSIDEAVQEALKVYVPVQQKTAIKVVEPEVIDLIHKAQQRDKVTFCLTSRGDYIEKATIEQLDQLGLNFNQGVFKDKRYCLFEETQRTLSHGIIFAEGGRNKGKCLQKTLELLGSYKPKRIVMIDDKLSYLENVQQVCAKLEIEFVGLRYGYLDEKIARLNVDIVKMQLEKYNHPILSDEEAQVLVKAANQTKCGIELNAEKQRGLLWSIDDYQLYQNILKIDPSLKAFRRKPKYLNVNGTPELCCRFKIPFADLLSLLPKIEAAKVIPQAELIKVKASVEEGMVQSEKKDAVLVQFDRYRQDQQADKDAKQEKHKKQLKM